MPDRIRFEFTAELWRYQGEAGWYFVTLPVDVADGIDDAAGARAGFGSVPVVVTVGDTTWSTSVFPDKKAASFVLPIKSRVRSVEGLEAGGPVMVRLDIDRERLPS